MIALLQRVKQAAIEVDQKQVASIQQGLLVFVAVQPEDDFQDVYRIFERISKYRIFADDVGKMNLSVVEIGADILLVPQFTLAADTQRGNRPSFSRCADTEKGRTLFEQLVVHAKQEYSMVQQGVFGADMQVSLINDGPVTFWLET